MEALFNEGDVHSVLQSKLPWSAKVAIFEFLPRHCLNTEFLGWWKLYVKWYLKPREKYARRGHKWARESPMSFASLVRYCLYCDYHYDEW
jgi:hypothetical protein